MFGLCSYDGWRWHDGRIEGSLAEVWTSGLYSKGSKWVWMVGRAGAAGGCASLKEAKAAAERMAEGKVEP